jgi:putative ABC transport system substrate-binding protein
MSPTLRAAWRPFGRPSDRRGGLTSYGPDFLDLYRRAAGYVDRIQQRTRVIPIVFAGGGDAVDNNFASGVARPTDNVTGFANAVTSLGSKWLELLKEAVPNIARVGRVFNSESVTAQPNAPEATVIDAAAPQLGIKIVTIPLRSPVEIERDISAFAAEPNGALLQTGIGLSTAQSETLRRLVLQYRPPTLYGGAPIVGEHLLMSHGPDVPELVRGAASYVDRILRGAKVSELPVQYPTKFQLVVNLNTAKAIGLTLPEMLLLRADELIE